MKKTYRKPMIKVAKIRGAFLMRPSKFRDSFDSLSSTNLTLGDLYALNCHDLSKATCGG